MTPDQWQELVSLYGDNAYLMCECEESQHWTNCNDWVSATKNEQIDRYININPEWYKIKDSAALPFDLAAANAGDAVELFAFSRWLPVNFATNYQGNNGLIRISCDCGADLIKSVEHLRMKNPRRVGENLTICKL